ncbi:hypothetical protein EX30DRAFT_138922 [Ascodesmis nigricans]|uniref:Uncharacterized protein n=1 Tax=Ascodesmis nigricans TaxID=341454 RepID=A0A4V3SJ56_9PEZI|nr:hypothetical protein EX30DRAFT_138922 [Ascodesmis nigricans]
MQPRVSSYKSNGGSLSSQPSPNRGLSQGSASVSCCDRLHFTLKHFMIFWAALEHGRVRCLKTYRILLWPPSTGRLTLLVRATHPKTTTKMHARLVHTCIKVNWFQSTRGGLVLEEN